MAKKKIKLDLSGGWRDVLEQAIDVNDVYAIESDLEDETALEITDRNFIIFSKLIHYIREDDTILFSPSEIRIPLSESASRSRKHRHRSRHLFHTHPNVRPPRTTTGLPMN